MATQAPNLKGLRDFLTRKLENAIEHLGTLAKRAKSGSSAQAQKAFTEMADLEREISDLRGALHYMADYESEVQEYR